MGKLNGINEQISKYLQPLLGFWEKQSKKRKTLIIGGTVSILAISFIIVLLLNIQTYTVLYSGMDETEAAAVIKSIQEKGVDCKLESGGNILVPKKQVDTLRMQLATEGYPKTATNYNLFLDNIDLMTTDFEKREIKIFQLNERLAATIKTISSIKNAIVTISIPENKGYAWETNKVTTTASVMVETIGNSTLTTSQVNGIKQLVSKSVEGLTIEDIAVVDTSGNELQASLSDTQMNITQLGFEIKKQFENDLKNKITTVMEPTFGKNNYQVSVSGIVNLDKKIQEIITYKPSDETNNTGVLQEGTKDTEIETDGSSTGGTAGTSSNTDLPSYSGITINGNIVSIKDNETYKYLVNQVKEQVSHDSAVLEKLYVAVTVNKETMTDLEKTEIRKLVAFAAATTTDNVFVYNAKFTTVTGTDSENDNPITNIWNSKQLIYIIAGAGGFLIILIIFIGILAKRRKAKKKAKEESETEEVLIDYTKQEIIPQLSVEEKIKSINDSRQMKTKEKIQDFTGKNPEIAAQLIRSWLRDEGDLND